MNKQQKILFFSLVLLAVCVLAATPLLAAPANAQVFYSTPTAEPNGNIYYTVKQGDTCESISLLVNVSLDQLRNLNQLSLDQCSFLQVGQKLLLGTVPTAVITPGPSPTPTSSLPTPMPEKGYGTICVYLYDDVNGDAIAQVQEITDKGLAGGEVSILNTEGGYAKVGTTLDTGEAICFEDAPEGEYTISMGIPDGYNPTSSQIYTIQLRAGDTSTIDFSAQASSFLNVTNEEKSKPGFLAVIGGLVLVAGVVLALYVKFFLRK